MVILWESMFVLTNVETKMSKTTTGLTRYLPLFAILKLANLVDGPSKLTASLINGKALETTILSHPRLQLK